MCKCQRMHLASLKGFVPWEEHIKQAKPDSSFKDRERTGNTHYVHFCLLLRRVEIHLLSGAGHTRSTQQGVALVSESALRLPEDGATEGPCRLIPRREILARVEESHPECLFLEAHSVGPGSLQSPLRSSFLLLIFLLPGPLFCLLSWMLQGAAF